MCLKIGMMLSRVLGLMINKRYFEDFSSEDEEPKSFEKNINLDVDLSHLLNLESAEEIVSYVKATNAEGERILMMPIAETGAAAWFDFCSDAPGINYQKGQEISIAQFVYDISWFLKNHIIPNGHHFRYLHISEVEGIRWRRLVWEPTIKSWYFQCELKEENVDCK